MSGDVRFLRSFSGREEAELLKALLESGGISVIVKTDDAGGFYPQMDVCGGIKLFVADEDYEDAMELLNSVDEGEDGESR